MSNSFGGVPFSVIVPEISPAWSINALVDKSDSAVARTFFIDLVCDSETRGNVTSGTGAGNCFVKYFTSGPAKGTKFETRNPKFPAACNFGVASEANCYSPRQAFRIFSCTGQFHH